MPSRPRTAPYTSRCALGASECPIRGTGPAGTVPRTYPLPTSPRAVLARPMLTPPSMDSFTAAARFVASVAPHLSIGEAAALLAFDPALAASVERHRELGRELRARLRLHAKRAKFRRRRLPARV